MFNLSLFKNIGFLLYLFVYLIIPYSATTQTLKVDFIRNLENSLNARDLEFIRKNFRNEESKNIPKKFSKIINDFPNSKWKIKRLKSDIADEDILRIKVSGKKLVNGEIYILESKFDYLFSMVNGKIDEGIIKNLFTTIRNDNKKIDIKKISLRFFMNFVTFVLLGIPLLYMYISKDKLSLSDIVSQTSYKKNS